METGLLWYQICEGVEAFSSRRDSALPYHVIQGHQVHGTRIAVIDSPSLTREDLEGYDAFVTSLKGVAIGVRTADCVPVLLYDPVAIVAAAVHSGWKGTVGRISTKTVSFMKDSFGCEPSRMKAVIGPAIGAKSFQVGKEVVEKFRGEGFPMGMIHSFEGDGDGSPMSGGDHIDLFMANKWLLEESGLREENIQLALIDTFADHSFFSARREGISCGRIINSIRIL